MSPAADRRYGPAPLPGSRGPVSAALVVDRLFAAHLLDAWAAGTTSLRPAPTPRRPITLPAPSAPTTPLSAVA